jgi:hypothetical protein
MQQPSMGTRQVNRVNTGKQSGTAKDLEWGAGTAPPSSTPAVQRGGRGGGAEAPRQKGASWWACCCGGGGRVGDGISAGSRQGNGAGGSNAKQLVPSKKATVSLRAAQPQQLVSCLWGRLLLGPGS